MRIDSQKKLGAQAKLYSTLGENDIIVIVRIGNFLQLTRYIGGHRTQPEDITLLVADAFELPRSATANRLLCEPFALVIMIYEICHSLGTMGNVVIATFGANNSHVERCPWKEAKIDNPIASILL